jgi:lipoprotein-anchoring transpeptidase ErfK/SrfK
MKSTIVAAIMAVAFSLTTLAPQAIAAPQPTKEELMLLKKKKAETVAKNKKILAAKKRQDELKKLKAQQVALQKRERAVRVSNRQACKGFVQCFFGSRKVRVVNQREQRVASLSGTGLSGRKTRRTIDWDSAQYPVGSIIVRTNERALYYVAGDGEAIRYSVGVGKEGFQWSGVNRISRKAEWPSWTPPKQMIEREAAKGHIIPEFMEGGPGNPLGARAMYVGGTVFRVHGTNNERSIGGAVSSGCIRMMNADVIDLYDRVKIGAKIYVY